MVRLLDDTVLNGTILMILITCTIASFIAQKGAQNIALAETAEEPSPEGENEERILIPVNYIETTEELINLSTTIKSKKSTLYALNIIDNNNPDKEADKKAKTILHKAAVTAAATDNSLQQLIRYDLNIVNGITSIVKEHRITDLILGLHHKKGITDSFLGDLTEGILTKCNTTTLIYKYTQPLATIKRYLVTVPDGAEREIGFPYWLIRVWNMARNTGAKLIFYASQKTMSYITAVHENHPLESEFNVFDDWNDFLIISRDIKKDDCLLIVLSRKEGISYNKSMARIPTYLNNYFQTINFILIYPIQSALMEGRSLAFANPSVLEPISDNLDDIGKTIANLFRRR